MTESNAPNLQEDFLAAVASLDQSAYEVYYLTDFFLKHSSTAKELVTLWFNALRLDKSRRCPLIYTANEVIARTVDLGQGSAAWGFIEAFGAVLEELVHYLGGERDVVSLQSLLKVLQVWERFPRAFLRDYLRLLSLLAEDYLASFLANSVEGLQVSAQPLTRKLQELAMLQGEFARLKKVCDDGRRGKAWLYQSCRARCLQVVEMQVTALMQMSRLLEREFSEWRAAEEGH